MKSLFCTRELAAAFITSIDVLRRARVTVR